MMPQILQQLLHDYEQAVVVSNSCFSWASVLPFGKQSVRFRIIRKGKKVFPLAYPDPEKSLYQHNLVREFRLDLCNHKFSEKLRLTVIYGFPFVGTDTNKEIEAGWKLMNVAPDLDNLSKPLMDAIEEIIEKNDSRIVDKRERKIRFKFPFIAIKIEDVVENYFKSLEQTFASSQLAMKGI